MKFFFSFIVLIVSLSGLSQIPQFEWASSLEKPGYMYERSVTIDSSQNVIITGNFTGWQDFDPGPATHNVQAVGGRDMFILKLDPNGDFLWVKTFGSFYTDRGFSVVTDSVGNIYANGYFRSTIDFDPDPAVYNLTPVSGESLGFILSLDTNGGFRWANLLPGYNNSTDSNYDFGPIAYGKDGSLFVSQRFSATTDFDPGPGSNLITPNGTEMYLMKINLSGGLIWVKHFEGNYKKKGVITAHSSGNIFISGSFSGTIDTDPNIGVANQVAIGPQDSFIIKLNSSGNLVWSKSFGGPDFVSPNSIAVDDQQAIYLAGIFKGTIDFDPGLGVQNLSSTGLKNPYLLKLDINGAYEWSYSYGGVLNNFEPYVTVDSDDALYLTGSFYDTMDIDPGIGVHNIIPTPSTVLSPNVDVFIAKIAPSSNLIWSKTFGSERNDFGFGITASFGDVFAIGGYDATIDFNPGVGNAIHTSSGRDDGYIIKYSQCYQSNPIPDVASLPDSVNQCRIDSLIPPTATSSCLGSVIGVSDVVFPITTIGNTIVTWTYDVGNGYVTTQEQSVSIVDTEGPIPNLTALNDLTYECSTLSLSTPNASDNCSSSVIVTNDAQFPIISDTVVVWTYDDGNGNVTTQVQNIIITDINNGISSIDEVTLEADESGYSYQWVDCNNGNAFIVGEVEKEFVATINGSYAVEISNGICSVMSDCINVNGVWVEEIKFSKFAVYPNPTAGLFQILALDNSGEFMIEIRNALGEIVVENSLVKDSVIEVDGKGGIYFVTLSQKGIVVYREKIIKL